MARFATPMAAATVVVLSAAAAVLAACAASGADDAAPAPDALGLDTSGGAAETVLVRGRIGADVLVLEPVLRTDAPPSLPGGGRHHLRGIDEAGEVAFDFRFDGERVAAGDEEQFAFSIPVGDGGALRLRRVELHTGDGRSAVRDAHFSRERLVDAAPGAVAAERLDDGRVRLRWDADRFPMVMVRDAETGQILSFARGGDVTLVADGDVFHVVVSEGVRSVGWTLRVAP